MLANRCNTGEREGVERGGGGRERVDAYDVEEGVWRQASYCYAKGIYRLLHPVMPYHASGTIYEEYDLAIDRLAQFQGRKKRQQSDSADYPMNSFNCI